jgi:ADP-glucose pyrophosphorylase
VAKGSRLFPLNDGALKPDFPIAGKYRLIDIPISSCVIQHILHCGIDPNNSFLNLGSADAVRKQPWKYRSRMRKMLILASDQPTGWIFTDR